MQRRTKGILLTCGLAAAAVLTVIVCRNQEPDYEGRPLSYWVAMFDGNHREEELKKAEEALNKIGTNALPFLLKWIQFERGTRPVRSKVTASIKRDSYSFYVLVHGRRELLSRSVTESFRILGEQAIPAVPELIRLMHEPSAPETAARATVALAHVGTNGLPALLAVADNPGHKCRYYALWSMPFIRGNLEPFGDAAVPILVRCLSEQRDPRVAPAAAAALGSFKSVPIAVSALTNCLASTNSLPHRYTAEALGLMGALAAPSLPALTNALDHADPQVKQAAKDAIFKITRDPGANASAKPGKAP